MPCIRSYMEESGERLDEEDDGMCGGRGIGVGDPESVEFFAIIQASLLTVTVLGR